MDSIIYKSIFLFLLVFVTNTIFCQSISDEKSDTTKTGLFHKDKKDKKKSEKDNSSSEGKDISNRGINSPKDTTKSVISVQMDSDAITPDTTHQDRENSPLDIGDDRGLYIMADKGMLQMRILGSVRFSAFYDFNYLESKNSFNTYEIKTGDDNYKLPNYYNSLNFSRLGFEVTRRTKKFDFFIRLEMDFAGTDNSFRIRHAYGQYGKFLIGQTWSLLCNVPALPANVDPNGPVGTIATRTPQLRINHKFNNRISSAFAIEYSLPDYTAPDTIQISFVQTIPNLAARVNLKGALGKHQIAGVIAPITGLEGSGAKNTTFGFGVSLSGIFDLKHSDQILYQATLGNAIAHFLNPFGGSGSDMAYDHLNQEFKGLGTYGGFISYGHHWPHNISSYFSFGIAALDNRDFQVGSDYNFSYDFSANAFWNVVEGLKVGLEVLYGQRFDVDNNSGDASRVWALFYYDF